jgi:hypothetical protein
LSVVPDPAWENGLERFRDPYHDSRVNAEKSTVCRYRHAPVRKTFADQTADRANAQDAKLTGS